jgi:ferric-dicitrate binding protein FerR (iron transport regulator)
MMHEDELRAFLPKLARHSYSRDELDAFLHWLNQLDDVAYAKVLNAYYLELEKITPGAMPSQEMVARRLEQQLDALEEQREVNNKDKHRKPAVYTRWMAAAAVAGLVVLAGVYVLRSPAHRDTTTAAVQPAPQHDIAPGGDKAVLTLADGTVILLDSAQNGTLARQNNAVIQKQNGQLLIRAHAVNPPAGAMLYNTITTPRGGQFQVLLPDGSRVWLNAASSLKFPAAFTGKERAVELQGEGYFEIARNTTTPFLVTAGGMKVQVLGTEFNITAYADEAAVSTTLVQGAVRIGDAGAAGRLLHPGQQAVLQHDAAAMKVTDISAADMEQVIAWKNGEFSFQDATVESVMRQLSRWYNVEVVYEGRLKERRLVGQVYRSYTLAQVLAVLEAADLHFRIENRKLVVRE